MSEKSLMPRKFRIGVWVKTSSGMVGKVIGSALYGLRFVQGKPVVTESSHVEYRVRVLDVAKSKSGHTVFKPKSRYITESLLRKANPPK